MVQRSYEAAAIRVHWNSDLCIHTGICLRSNGDVFDVNRRPWIDVDAAEADEIGRVVELCPTGALTYERLDGAPGEEPPRTTTIVPFPNGPLMVRGDIEVRDRRGDSFGARYRAALCRCGHSENQPFCDLSHRAAGFRNVARVRSPERAAAESPDDIATESGP